MRLVHIWEVADLRIITGLADPVEMFYLFPWLKHIGAGKSGSYVFSVFMHYIPAFYHNQHYFRQCS
jgi:hypothetical protein